MSGSSSKASACFNVRVKKKKRDGGEQDDKDMELAALRKKMGPAGIALGYFGKCRKVDEFEKLNRLGEGSYGTVYRGKDLKTGEVVALKKVRIHNEKDGFPKSSIREVRLLFNLRHPNIVDLKEVVVGQHPGSIFLVFEYCEHDIGALLDAMDRPFMGAEVKGLLQQMLRGLAHLHGNFVIHRDLKLSNLLLTNRGMLKLADFGMAREFSSPPEPITTNVVTLWYRAPELLFGAKQYNIAVDMWSCGCMFGELLYNRPLMTGKNEEHQCHLICQLLGRPNSKIWPGIDFLPLYQRWEANLPLNDLNNLKVKFPEATDGCLNLLNRMLCYDPDKRESAASSLQHYYFSESPAPQEPQWMPSFKEHRNEGCNTRGLGANKAAERHREALAAAKRPPPDVTQGRALLDAARRMKSSKIGL